MSEEIMKLKDISNQKFGKLTAIEIAYRKGHFTYWHCKCECGKEKDVLISNLTCGKTISCGCSYKDMGQRLRKFNEYKINNNIVTMKTFNTNRNFYFDLDDLDKVKDLNISPEFILEQAKKVYEKYSRNRNEYKNERLILYHNRLVTTYTDKSEVQQYYNVDGTLKKGFTDVRTAYHCRDDKKHTCYDRLALLKCSQNLGHNRACIVADHYLWNDI